MQTTKRYAVSVEICHVETEQRADELAESIRDRLSDLDEDVYLCIASYVQVGERSSLLKTA